MMNQRSSCAGIDFRSEVPQPTVPSTPAVPEAPISPAVPDPGTPAAPEEPATVPAPDDPVTPIVPDEPGQAPEVDPEREQPIEPAGPPQTP